MVEILCPHNKEHGWIKLDYYSQHLALMHPDQIEEQAIQSLTTLMDKVEYLLRNIPSTRSNDKVLYERVLQYFSHDIVYNANTGKIQPRDPSGWSFDEWMAFPSYETCRRSRQHLQEKYPELRASEKVQLVRQVKERAYHNFFAGNRDE